MNALCILKTNVRVAVVSLLFIYSFETQSQSAPEVSKNDQQDNKQETSYINQVGPLPYGKQLDSPIEEPLVEAHVEPETSSQDQRLVRLKELEANHGPYDRNLLRELIPLGLEYAEQGEHKLARNAFLRSLEIHRVNFGLHSPGKFAIVEQLILVNRDLGEWREVNKYYEYLYWLYRRTYGEDSTKLIPMLSALIEWKTEAINEQLFGDSKTLFNEAQRASRRAREISKQHSQSQLQKAPASLTQ
jgi:hypothetical protein